ncbi:MAG: flagella basal body P-ring formation protein FlgA [Cycloclasticus sp.]
MKNILAVCLWLLVLMNSALAEVKSLILRSNVFVDAGAITFQQLFTTVMPKELAGIVVTKSPRIGISLTITKRYLENILRQRGYNSLMVTGNEEVIVRVNSQGLPLKDVTRYLYNELKSFYQVDEGRLELDIELSSSILVPAGKIGYRLVNVQPQELKERNYVWLSISVDAHYYQTLKVAVNAVHLQLLPFAKRNIEKGAGIGETSVTYRVVNGLKYTSPLLTIKAGQWVTKRFIRKGSAVTTSMIEELALVNIGDIFKGSSVVGSVIIEVSLKALEKGFLSDVINVVLVGKESSQFKARIKINSLGHIIGVVE